MTLRRLLHAETPANPAHYLAGGLAIAAGLVHVAVAPEHFLEWVPFGVFMVVVGAAQMLAGVLLVARPSRLLVTATIAGTAMLFIIFAVVYTVGLPFGPMPWERETMGAAVVISKALELALLLVLGLMMRGDSDALARQ